MQRNLFLISTLVLATGACTASDRDALDRQSVSAATPAPVPVAPSKVEPAAAALPRVLVHKSASCGCCALWVDHMREAGFEVEVDDRDDITPIKERLGVPYGHGSCHTAEVGGYFIEGHVPAADVKRLLAERPDAKGLVLPGMPLGSPGMEVPSGEVQPYVVYLVGKDGVVRPYAQHR